MAERGLSYHSGQVNSQLLGLAAIDYTPLLFYYHLNDTLYAWLVFSPRLIIRGAYPVSRDELFLKEIQFKTQLGIYSSYSYRGANIVSDSSRQNHDMNDELVDILFPGEIKKYIRQLNYLTISTVLNLGTIPYYLLKPFHKDSFLIDYLCINYTRSIDDFIEHAYFYQYEYIKKQYDRLVFDPLEPLIIGNPIYGAACQQQFTLLPGAEKEAEMVAEIFNCEALTGGKATRKAIHERVEQTDLIYFATHGISSSEQPMDESYLVLASDSSGNCDFLTARQIQELPLDEDMVILSACRTAAGKAHRAGTIGVARSFLNAGAQNVIMSLWNIDDQKTVAFMELFMQELGVPTPFFPAQNLRQAMLKYRQQNDNPAHWGAFIGFGSPYNPEIIVHLLIENK